MEEAPTDAPKCPSCDIEMEKGIVRSPASIDWYPGDKAPIFSITSKGTRISEAGLAANIPGFRCRTCGCILLFPKVSEKLI